MALDMALYLSQLLLTSDRPTLDSLGSAEGFEAVIEQPFSRVFNGFVEDEGQEGHCCQSKLEHG